MSEEEVNALISEADSNGDGVLNYEEFVKMLTSNWTNKDIDQLSIQLNSTQLSEES